MTDLIQMLDLAVDCMDRALGVFLYLFVFPAHEFLEI